MQARHQRAGGSAHPQHHLGLSAAPAFRLPHSPAELPETIRIESYAHNISFSVQQRKVITATFLFQASSVKTHSEARGKRVIGVALPCGAHGTSKVFCHVDCAVRRFRKIADEPDRMGPIFENASESLLRGASVFGKSRVNAS